MAKVNAKSSEGCTALAFAIDCTFDDDRAIECAKILLEARADVTRNLVLVCRVLRGCCFEVLFWDGPSTRIQTCDLGSMWRNSKS